MVAGYIRAWMRAPSGSLGRAETGAWLREQGLPIWRMSSEEVYALLVELEQ